MWLKLLIIAGVLYTVYRWAGGRILPRKTENGKEGLREAERDGETLVECRRCSTYVVAKEAFVFRGAYYCSRECLPNSVEKEKERC